MDNLERNDMLNLLYKTNYRPLVDALMNDEEIVFTRKGRVNKSALCKLLKCNLKQLEEAFKKCRDALRKDYELN